MNLFNEELTLHQKHQHIVKKFCREPINWAANYKIAKKLLTLYNFDIFDSLELGWKLNGLQFFLCDVGKELLEKEKNKKELVLLPKAEYKIEKEKVGADYERKNKKQSIMDFIDDKV